MIFANRKPRRRKTRWEILQTAKDHIMSNIEGRPNYWGERIYRVLVNMWETAFTRGYQKALDDLDPNKPGKLPKAQDLL